ncbi:MAG TPA: alanine racemase [Nitrospiraceae bacterium]|nr:alanine racemase [Nitrospiraceae bacterium]
MTSNSTLLPTYATIHLAALAHNLSQIKRYLSHDCDIMAVVKANAYGHGAVETAQALSHQGIERFAVASLDEGITLRHADLSASIIVLGAPLEEQVPDLVAYRLTPVVSDGLILPSLAKAARSQPAPYPIHLKLETGMGRLGLSPEELLSLLDDPILRGPLHIEGLMTHLADADGTDSAFTERQLGLFRSMVEQIQQRGLTIPLLHTANSAAIVRFPDTHFSLVRPGIMLYGYHTLPPSIPAPDLKPVLSLQSTIVQLRSIPRGGTVSYNGTFVAKRPTRIAVLPIGYADGYSRRLSHRASVLIQGRRAPIIGLVCMDMIMIDVTDFGPVQVGETVTLIGQQGQESIQADEVSSWMDTIPYEVLCGIGPRVPRLYESA